MLWTSLPPSPCLWCNTVPLHCLPSLIHRCSVISCTVPTLLIRSIAASALSPPPVVVVSFSLNETNKNEHVPSHFLLFLFHSSHLWSEPPDLHFPLHHLCSRLPTFFHLKCKKKNKQHSQQSSSEQHWEQRGHLAGKQRRAEWSWWQRVGLIAETEQVWRGGVRKTQTNRTQAHKQNCHLAAHPQI